MPKMGRIKASCNTASFCSKALRIKRFHMPCPLGGISGCQFKYPRTAGKCCTSSLYPRLTHCNAQTFKDTQATARKQRDWDRGQVFVAMTIMKLTGTFY